MKKAIINNWSYIFSALFLLVCLCFIVIQGQNILVQIHDNLDSNIVWLKMMSDNNLIFNTKGEVPFLGGIDRLYLYSPFKVYIWFYSFMSAFAAYTTTWFLKVIISILGFIFLGKVFDKNFIENKHVYTLCGLLYGLMPTYPTSAFSFASLPFLMACLILYYKNPKIKYLPLFLIYPLFSDVTVFGVFICGYLLLYILYLNIKEKKFDIKLFLPLIMLSCGYLITDFNIFYTMLFSTDASLRSEMINDVHNLKESLKFFIDGFFIGQYHAGSLHTYVILPICILFVLVQNIIFIKNKEYKNIIKSPMNILFCFIFISSIIYALDYYEPVKNFIGTIIPFLNGFSYSRTLWLNPFLWVFLFALVVCEMTKIKKLRYIFIFAAIVAICCFKSEYNHLQDNLNAIKYNFKHKPLKTLTYKQFYSEKLFEKIKKDINYNGEWSCAFAMHPGVIEYNGIKTLDGYLSYYPLYYKNKFKELIAPELEIDEKYSDYFNNWGGRAYLYSKEVTFLPVLNFETEEARLNINPDVFKEMNGKYIFSRIKISNYKDLGFKFINKYTDNDSLYEIYVYSI